MAIDTTALNKLITDFRALSQKDSVSPESLGSLLQKLADLLASCPADSEVSNALNSVNRTITSLQSDLQNIARSAVTTDELSKALKGKADDLAYYVDKDTIEFRPGTLKVASQQIAMAIADIVNGNKLRDKNIEAKADSTELHVVLESMGVTLDNVDNTGDSAIIYVANVGDIYYSEGKGHLFFKKSETETIDLGEPNDNKIYANAMTKRLYIWKGGTWRQCGTDAYTKAESDALFSGKVNKTDIVQSTGTSTTAVMSQKASTMAFAANTPSGDPIHNLYLSIGAIWNSDTGFWEMNTLTDLTNEDMSNIYTMGFVRPLGVSRFEFSPFSYSKGNFIKARTTVKSYYQSTSDIPLISPSFTWNCSIEVINFLDKYKDLKIDNFVCFSYCWKLKKILDSVSPTTTMTLNECEELEEVYFLLNYNISFKDSPKLSVASVKYMVENVSSSAITITLHPEAYERAIADAGVQAALANKTNVSLAKGE